MERYTVGSKLHGKTMQMIGENRDEKLEISDWTWKMNNELF